MFDFFFLMSSRFLHAFSRSPGGDLLLEVLLPSGTVTGVFRHLDRRSVAVEGVIDKVKWTCVSDVPLETEVIELVLPRDFEASNVAVHVNEAEGRVVFKVRKGMEFS